MTGISSIESGSSTDKLEAKCPRCGWTNKLFPDGKTRVCLSPACDAEVVCDTSGGQWAYGYTWTWSPIPMNCSHCRKELHIQVEEHAVMKYVCVNPECPCYDR